MNQDLANQVKAAASFYNYKGPLEPGMVHLIADEGFVPTEYADDRDAVGKEPVATEGVGQTGENRGKNFFTEVYPAYQAKAAKMVKGYSNMPVPLQNAILSAVYRGDLGPKTAKLLSDGKYAEAAEEYLDHDEYRQRKKKDPRNGVVLRMERNAAAMKDAAKAEKGRGGSHR